MAKPTLSLVDVENQEGITVKKVKAIVKQADHCEYASKEQLEAVKANLQAKIVEIDRRLKIFPKEIGK